MWIYTAHNRNTSDALHTLILKEENQLGKWKVHSKNDCYN